MKIFKNKVFTNYLVLFISLFMIEVIFRYISALPFLSIDFLRIFLLINILSIVLSFLISLISLKSSKIIRLLIILLFSIYAFAQLDFNNFIGVYMSFNTTSQAVAVKDYIIDFLKSTKPIYLIIFIPLIINIIKYIIDLKIYKNDFKLKRNYIYEYQIISISLIIMLIVSIGGFYQLMGDKYSTDSYQVVSTKELFKNVSNPTLCIKNFGIISYSLLDLRSKYFGTSTDNLDYTYYAYDKVEDTSRKIDDTAWKNVINSETNTIYNNLNNYFINKEITEKNDYTGLFKDKNLIIIMMESVNDLIVDPEYFPNFANMMDNGWYFENNYSPRNSCATGNNEFSALTSLYSIYNNCTANIYKDNTYYESMFNLFNNAGYLTNSMHNYNETYYYRRTIHPNMGSQNYYDVDSLNIEYYKYYGGWSSDEDLMLKFLEKLDENKPERFMSYLTTVTSHQPYSSSVYGDMYLDLFKDTNYSIELKRYLSKLKVVDNALGDLINGLKERDLLEDTVIVMFGDHYPYGLPIEILNEKLERPLDNYENEKVPLLIYNPSLEGKIYDTYTSYINLLPTLANLFDLDYDPRIYQGTDIFSDSYNNIVAFPDMSWKNNLAYFNARTENIEYFTDFTYTDEEIKRINEEIYAKMNTSSIAIKNNYFAYLEKALASKEETES